MICRADGHGKKSCTKIIVLFYVKRRIVSNVTIVIDIIGRTLIKYIMH